MTTKSFSYPYMECPACSLWYNPELGKHICPMVAPVIPVESLDSKLDKIIELLKEIKTNLRYSRKD